MATFPSPDTNKCKSAGFVTGKLRGVNVRGSHTANDAVDIVRLWQGTFD